MRPDDWRARFLGISRELSHLSEPRERAELYSRAKNVAWSRYFWLYCVLTLLPALLLAFLLPRAVPQIQAARWRGEVVAFALYLVVVLAPLATIFWLSRRSVQQFARRQLWNRGICVCMTCGYDLRGQTELRCPECGRPFEPQNAS